MCAHWSVQTEEEEARLAAERAKQRREKEAAKQRRRERLGDDYVSEDEEEEEGEVVREVGEGDEGEAGEEEEQEEKPKGPSPILAVFHSSEEDGEFWVSMVRQQSAHLLTSHDLYSLRLSREATMQATCTAAPWKERGKNQSPTRPHIPFPFQHSMAGTSPCTLWLSGEPTSPSAGMRHDVM